MKRLLLIANLTQIVSYFKCKVKGNYKTSGVVLLFEGVNIRSNHCFINQQQLFYLTEIEIPHFGVIPSKNAHIL